jgi:hypothetical protein
MENPRINKNTKIVNKIEEFEERQSHALASFSLRTSIVHCLLRAAATRPPYSFTLSSTVFLALAAITTHMIMSVLLSRGAEIVTWKKAHDDLVL